MPENFLFFLFCQIKKDAPRERPNNSNLFHLADDSRLGAEIDEGFANADRGALIDQEDAARSLRVGGKERLALFVEVDASGIGKGEVFAPLLRSKDEEDAGEIPRRTRMIEPFAGSARPRPREIRVAQDFTAPSGATTAFIVR